MRIEITDKSNFINMLNQMYSDVNIENINGVTIDSRKVMENDIFIPIKGENYNGHDFIKKALSKGAICFSEKKINKKNIIHIESSLNEINTICKKWKDLSKAKIIGITGSNGKTTTKDLLYNIFSKKYSCSKTIGNFNSSIGFPISFLSTNLNDDFCILEYGASKPNEIKKLCEIINPDFSYITNISKAHIENFSSTNELFNTKMDLYRSTKNEGICFINSDNISITKEKIKNTLTYSLKKNYTTIFSKKKNMYYFKINDEKIYIPLHLNHIYENILAACIISKKFKIELNDIIDSINKFNLPVGRGNIIDFSDYKLIDDSYNSNPASMISAIKRINGISIKGKKILIFGDMLELGEDSIKEHIKIAEAINQSTIDIVLTFGDISKNIADSISKSKYSKHYIERKKLKIELNNLICKNDMIYVKGSRGMKLERIFLNNK